MLKKLRAWLQGKPDKYLTFILLGMSVFGIFVALFAPPELKLAVTLYFGLP